MDASLEQRLAALEKAWKEVDLEWSEWFHKFRLLYARLAKKVKEVEKIEAADGAVQPGGDLLGVAAPSLSPREALIQRQIAARRRANGGGE